MTKTATLTARITPDLLAELQQFAASRPGTLSEHVRYAVRLYLEQNQSEGRESNMTSAELFDRLAGGQVTTAEVAAMDVEDIEAQITAWRGEGWLGDLPASDAFLAEKVHRYAVQDN